MYRNLFNDIFSGPIYNATQFQIYGNRNSREILYFLKMKIR